MLILQIFQFRSLLMIALLLVATATSSCAQEKPKRMIPGPSVKELVPEWPNEKEDGVSQIILAQLFTPGPTEYTHVGTSALKNSPPLPTGYTLYNDRVYEVKTQAIFRPAFNVTVFSIPSVENEQDFKRLAILHLEDDEMNPIGKSWNEVTLFPGAVDEQAFHFVPKVKYDSLQPDFKSKRIAGVTDQFGIFAVALGPEPEPESSDPFTKVEVTPTSSPDQVTEDGEVTHTIIVKNTGPKDAGDVNVMDEIHGYLQYVSAKSSQGTCKESKQSNGRILCHLGALPTGGIATITIVARIRPNMMLTKDKTDVGNLLEVIFKERPSDFVESRGQIRTQFNTTILRKR